MEKRCIVGITGGIGSGKSFVCRALKARGWHIYDTDSRAKWLIVNDPEVRTEIIDIFGPEAYDGDRYRTEYVGPMVFSNPTLLERLNSVVHPAVRREIEEVGSGKWEVGSGMLVVESAILFSAGLNEICDRTVWVDAPLEVRMERAMRRDGATREQVEARIRAQKNEADRCDLSLMNDGTVPIEDIVDRIEQMIR